MLEKGKASFKSPKLNLQYRVRIYATDVDISHLTAKKDFVTLKAEVDKLDNNKMINFLVWII